MTDGSKCHRLGDTQQTRVRGKSVFGVFIGERGRHKCGRALGTEKEERAGQAAVMAQLELGVVSRMIKQIIERHGFGIWHHKYGEFELNNSGEVRWALVHWLRWRILVAWRWVVS